jgi:hypothetical protein
MVRWVHFFMKREIKLVMNFFVYLVDKVVYCRRVSDIKAIIPIGLNLNLKEILIENRIPWGGF